MVGRPSKRTPEREARVYLLWAEYTDIFKVGYTQTSVDQRLKAIQSMSPIPLRLIGTRDGSRSEEAAIHRYWQPCRVNGEWFGLDAQGALEMMASFGKDVRGIELPLAERLDDIAYEVVLWFAAQRIWQRTKDGSII